MQRFSVLPLFTSMLTVATAGSSESSPLTAVEQLLTDLAAKLEKDKEAESKAFEAFHDWCSDNSRSLQYEIKTLSKSKQQLEAFIAKHTSDVQVAVGKIEDLVSETSRVDAERTKAQKMREKESAQFKVDEEDLVLTQQEIQGAIDNLKRVAAASQGAPSQGPALAQVDTPKLDAVLHSLEALSEAAAVESSDVKQLASLVQSAADDSSGTRTAGHDDGLLAMLENMNEKMSENLDKTRAAEATAIKQNQLMMNSLDLESQAFARELQQTKAKKAESESGSAAAQGDLARVNANLKEVNASLQAANDRCVQTAADHEASMKKRTAELSAIEEGKKAILDGTAGVRKRSSMLQKGTSSSVHSSKHSSRIAGSEIAALVRRLATTYHSKSLDQLASRITTVLKFAAHGGQDPYAKVKAMIANLVARLQAQAQEDADQKSFCDKETAKTNGKREDLDAFIDKKSLQVDQSSSRSASLNEEVKDAQASLAALAKAQSELDRVRAESNAGYTEAKADLENGVSGVRRGIATLQKYFGPSASASSLVQDEEGNFGSLMQQPAIPEMSSGSPDAGGNIVKILEMIEADLAQDLVETEANESDEADAYETLTQENRVTRASLEQDVVYKTRERKATDKSLSGYQTDKDTAVNEMAAVEEYAAKLRERCTSAPDTYAERKRSRDAELAGLREALSMLEGDTALVQRRSRRLRGN